MAAFHLPLSLMQLSWSWLNAREIKQRDGTRKLGRDSRGIDWMVSVSKLTKLPLDRHAVSLVGVKEVPGVSPALWPVTISLKEYLGNLSSTIRLKGGWLWATNCCRRMSVWGHNRFMAYHKCCRESESGNGDYSFPCTILSHLLKYIGNKLNRNWMEDTLHTTYKQLIGSNAAECCDSTYGNAEKINESGTHRSSSCYTVYFRCSEKYILSGPEDLPLHSACEPPSGTCLVTEVGESRPKLDMISGTSNKMIQRGELMF